MKKLILFVNVLLLHAINNYTLAQCAMCKASVESNINTTSQHVGKGLNDGILYLMTVPYILLALLLWYFFGGKVKAFINQFKNIYPNV